MVDATDFLFLDWAKCLRGYELSPPTEAELAEFGDAEIYIRPLDEAHSVFEVTEEIKRGGVDIVAKAANARTDQDILNFHNEFGPLTYFGGDVPGHVPLSEVPADRKEQWMYGTGLSKWKTCRQEFCSALDKIRDGYVDRGMMGDLDIDFWLNDMGGADAKLIRVRGKQRPQLRYKLRSLRGLIWVYIANIVSEGGKVANCLVCGNYMVLGKTGSNSNQKTCSSRCRKALSRSASSTNHLPKV